MAAVGDNNQARSSNASSNFVGEFWWCCLIAFANEYQRRARNRSKAGARVRTAQDRLLLAQVSLDAGCLGHLPDYALKRFIAMSVAMHVDRKSLFRNLRVAAFLGEPHQHAATFGLLRRVGTR